MLIKNHSYLIDPYPLCEAAVTFAGQVVSEVTGGSFFVECHRPVFLKVKDKLCWLLDDVYYPCRR